MAFAHSSGVRLTARDEGRFPGDTLFDRVGRAVCRAGCLPRKELFEAWEVARRVRRRFRGGRIVDACAGHGLLAHLMLLLDDSSPSAVAVDSTRPPCSARLEAALLERWPRLARRVSYIEAPLESIELHASDVVVSSHACGGLTDAILARAVAAGARVAVLPCCHAVPRDQDALSGWLDGPLAIDVGRVVRLERAGYRVRTQTIPAAITPRNRLIIAAPDNGVTDG